MAGKKLSYEIDVDSSKGVQGLKQFSSAVKREMKSVDDGLDDTATAGERVARVLSQMASKLDTELSEAARAADALKAAMGDVGERADVGSIVADLNRMGLTFDEITTDADKLAASLKELDGVQVKAIDSGLQNVDTSLGKVGKSADSSKSVLANMVGNATQDLGALSGVAGSAGVAIGQMGEYMADARANGEGFSTIFKSFAGVAGPIAAISIATAVIGARMEKIAKAKAFETEQLQKYIEAIAEGVDQTQLLQEELQNTGKIKLEDLRGNISDISDDMREMGITVEEFTALGEANTAEQQQWITQMKELGFSTKEIAEIFSAAETATDAWSNAEIRAANNALLLADSQAQVNTEFDTWLDNQQSLGERFPETMGRIVTAIRSGVAPSMADLNEITEKTGLTTEEVFTAGAEVVDGMNDKLRAQGDILTNTERQWATRRSNLEATATLAEELAAAEKDLADALMAQQSAMENSADAALAAEEAQEAFVTAAHESLAVQEDSTKSSEEKAEAVDRERDAAIDSAKAERDRAQAMAEASGETYTAAQSAESMNTSLLNQAQYATPAARREIYKYVLDLNGIPEEKQTEIFALSDEEQLAAIQTAIDEAAADRESNISIDADATHAMAVIASVERRLAGLKNVAFELGAGTRIYDAGGVVPPGGGIAAEIGPEFAQLPSGKKLLLTGPSAVPAGTRVTSRRETARILRAPRPHFDGGTGGSGSPTVNVRIDTGGVFSNEFAFARIVRRAVNDGVRLAGTRT